MDRAEPGQALVLPPGWVHAGISNRVEIALFACPGTGVSNWSRIPR
ncbi:hypothetical protein [Actinoplanes xinjiangensis]|nr:hypothetical protein [Actinoplanes xinjiangensis]